MDDDPARPNCGALSVSGTDRLSVGDGQSAKLVQRGGPGVAEIRLQDIRSDADASCDFCCLRLRPSRLMTTVAGAEEVRMLGLGYPYCGAWTAAQVALAIDTKFV